MNPSQQQEPSRRATSAARLKLAGPALLGATIVQGAFGSPLPNRYDLTVVLVGILLVVALASMHFGSTVLRLLALGSKLQKAAVGGWLYLAVVPLLVGSLAGWPNSDMIRDVFPHLFLLIPIVVASRRWRLPHTLVAWFPLAATAAGYTVALRSLLITTPDIAALGLTFFGFDNFLMLAQDALVMFSAVAGPLLGIEHVRSSTGTERLLGVALIAGGVLPLVAFAGILARLPMALVALAYLAVSVQSMNTATRASTLIPTLLFLAAITALVLSPLGHQITHGLILKTRELGDNARIPEWAAVLSSTLSTPSKAVFGAGWGALLEVPSMGWYFSFTHSIFSYYFFKAGVVGVWAILAYFVWFARYLPRAWAANRAVAAGVMAVVIYAGLFEAAFKGVSFALVLALLPLAATSETNSDRETQGNRQAGAVLHGKEGYD